MPAGLPAGRSYQAKQPIVHVPGEDNLDSGYSENKNIEMGPPAQPVPAPLRKHARKPSDGASKELPPIAEVGKSGDDKKKLESPESSDNDTLVEVHSVKEVL